MSPNLILSDGELHRFTDSEDWADKAYALLAQQEESWELLASNYRDLAKVRTKDLTIQGSTYRIQFNPGRISSTSAKVDEQSIRTRACFLCPANLPAMQRGLIFDSDFIILCNPFPIFAEHFTIAHREHRPQQVTDSFPSLLNLSRELSERYFLLYNGPKCGASAPDHLHFQAGEKGFLPIDDEYEALITGSGEKIADVDGLVGFAVPDFLRRFISLEGDDADLLRKAFTILYLSLQNAVGTNEEPMINMLCSFQDGEWRIVVFPRAKHRPSFFFFDEPERLLISPAAVDLGGVIITPLERDFHTVGEQHLIEMLEEVMISRSLFDALTANLRERFATLTKS